jgi:cytochrome c553
MKYLTRGLLILALALSGNVHALQQGVVADGRHFVSGGVSEEERETLSAQRESHSLWIVTALRKTGEYLSAVRLTVTDAQHKVVFDAALDGPWLLIDLPVGKYSVEARFEGQVQQRATTIHPGDHHQAIFYFDAPAEGRTDATTMVPSLYLGWRAYQGHCARCHGPAAEGSDSAPDLLPRVRGMSEERFASTVLQRYQWVVPRSEAAGEGAGRDALIQDILHRREGPLEMPLWEREPAVRAHIDDLYRYLRERASGAVGSGRPPGP